MNSSELERFWSQKNYKIYVVSLRHATGKVKPETRYVRIKEFTDSPEARLRAARIAVANSVDFSSGRQLYWSARLAHPVSDLGCVESRPKLSAVAA